MTFFGALQLSALTAAGLWVPLHRVLGLKFMLRHSRFVDVGTTIFLLALFHGTYSGALVSVMTGLFLSFGLVIATRIEKVTGFLTKWFKP